MIEDLGLYVVERSQIAIEHNLLVPHDMDKALDVDGARRNQCNITYGFGPIVDSVAIVFQDRPFRKPIKGVCPKPILQSRAETLLARESERPESEGRITILALKSNVMLYVLLERASRSQRGGRGFESRHLLHEMDRAGSRFRLYYPRAEQTHLSA